MKKLSDRKRKKLIEALVNDDFNTIIECNGICYLFDLLRDGHKGYINYSDYELRKEIKMRDF